MMSSPSGCPRRCKAAPPKAPRLHGGRTLRICFTEMDQPELPVVDHQHLVLDGPLMLDCGTELSRVRIAYRTYGTLNAARSNAILICDALTGDQYVAEPHPVTGKGGWWDMVVGPGLPIDTDRYFVICSNVLGGCMGSTGARTPKGDDPNDLWGTDFPPVTIRDMVRAQKRMVEHRAAVRGDRWLHGRHAGAAMGGELPGSGVRRGADRHRPLPLRPEHRLQRGWPAIDLR